MRSDRFDIVRRVRADIMPTETSAYEALGNLGKLLHTTCAARQDADLPLEVSQEPIGILSEATAMMGQVCARIVLAHKALAKGGAILVPEVGFGDTRPCPTQGELDGVERASSPVRLVG